MRRYHYLVISILVIIIAGCQSREKKDISLEENALKTIKEYMYKNLDDFKSYEPIETEIDSLTAKYGDTLVVKTALQLKLMDGLIDCFEKDYKNAKEIFIIWDDPQMYKYSSYAYNKRKKAYEDMTNAAIGREVTINVRNDLLDTLLILEKNHKDELYGWRVNHRYRCNTSEGTPSIIDCVFFMDKNCRKIICRLNEELISWNEYVRYIDRAYNEAKQKKEEKGKETGVIK